MTFRLHASLLAALGSAVLVAGCQERLTAPGSCPATCPGGTPVVRDTVLDAVVDSDQTYIGYLVRGSTGGGMRLSNGFHGVTDLGLLRFLPRADSVLVRDTLRSYTIDSVAISVTLLARDTTASGMVLELRRAPASTDTGASYASLASIAASGAVVDSTTIADSIRAGQTVNGTKVSHTYRFVFSGSDLSTVDIPASDSGVLTLVLALTGATTSGVRVGGGGSSGAVPLFQTYVTANVPDTATAIKHQLVQRAPKATRWVSSVDPVNDPNLLIVGTVDGARVLIHFPFPEYLKDSALISRGTLELTPADTIRGLSTDTAAVLVNGLIADFGAKSPLAGAPGSAGFRAMTFGSTDTVRIEVGAELKNWQRSTLPHPTAFMLQLSPDGASFTEPRFYSTRSPAGRPRLHVTYQLPFAFERP